MSGSGPGSRNALTDIPGLRVGNAEDEKVRTGVTVVAFDDVMRCAADVRGGGPATRETPAVGSEATLGIAHGITLSGGSVFGLAAADEVAAQLSNTGVGFCPVPATPPVPIIPAASLYDLSNHGDKDWGVLPPYRRLASEAMERAADEFRCGSVGAGFGATAGAWRGGLGSASIDLGGHGIVAALIAVNSIGSPVMPESRCFWSWPFEMDGEFGGQRPDARVAVSAPIPPDVKGGVAGQATCIGVVATSMPLSRTDLMRVAIMAQDGLARAIRPSHAPLDGDTIFAVCPNTPTDDDYAAAMTLGSAAADCVARAVARGVWLAEPADGFAPTVRGTSV